MLEGGAFSRSVAVSQFQQEGEPVREDEIAVQLDASGLALCARVPE